MCLSHSACFEQTYPHLILHWHDFQCRELVYEQIYNTTLSEAQLTLNETGGLRVRLLF